MKYYIYISDAKVNMLLSQVPHEVKKKIATEIKFDLKLLSVSRKAETESEDSRIARLEAVTLFIREYGNLGTVDEPDEYIEDQMPMRWGPYINVYAHDYRDESPIVYFGGATENTIVGLGGSSKHVIGNTGQSKTNSYSNTPFLISFLVKELSLNPEDERLRLPGSRFNGRELEAVENATLQMAGPMQQVEFMAKRLLHGVNGYGNKALLATPLYVAMTE